MVKLDSESQSGMIRTVTASAEHWVDEVLHVLEVDGVLVIDDALSLGTCLELCAFVKEGLQIVEREIGIDRLTRAGESGVLRFPLKFFPQFSCLLENPQVDEVIDRVIGKSAICHLMNAILLKPMSAQDSSTHSDLFQSRYHRDFPRSLGGKPLSINAFYCLTDFSEVNGSTRFVVGSQQRDDLSVPTSLGTPEPVRARAGSVIVFDSTIWHAGGNNSATHDRIGVNTQWTFHWIKQQIDLVRYLGADSRSDFSPRVQQRLGFNSQVVTSLQEYYVSEGERKYRPGQG